MFEDFDFSALKKPSFKEDAVREVIIALILKKAGYLPTGDLSVERSKTLVQSFVMIGSEKHRVNAIPVHPQCPANATLKCSVCGV